MKTLIVSAWLWLWAGMFPLIALDWMTSLPDALSKAQAEDKAVLAYFTGSDWCGLCKCMQKEIFDKSAYAQFAERNLISVKIDFPRRQPLPREQQEVNERLKAEHHIKWYPTVLIFHKNGKKLGETGYVEGGPGPFIKSFVCFSGYDWKVESEGGAEAPPPAPSQPAPGNAPKAPASKKVVPPTEYVPRDQPPINMTLTLKGIVGNKNRRLALINNESLAAGESATIDLAGQRVKIQCREILDAAAVVQVEGEKEPRRLEIKKAAP